MRVKALVLFAICILSITPCVMGNGPVISGMVYYGDTNRIATNVPVTLNYGPISTLTDGNGQFFFNWIPGPIPGNHFVEVRCYRGWNYFYGRANVYVDKTGHSSPVTISLTKQF